jgi:hypothetical protein
VADDEVEDDISKISLLKHTKSRTKDYEVGEDVAEEAKLIQLVVVLLYVKT